MRTTPARPAPDTTPVAPEEQLSALLIDRHPATLSTAESCTGGTIAARLTSVPGSSAYVIGGLVAYDNTVKERLLGVSPEILDHVGAVSAECAEAMAAGALALFETDFAVSSTGIAGPSGGSARKPVGLVYIGIASKAANRVVECQFDGDRGGIVAQATERALRELVRFVERQAADPPRPG
jgi:nicotinamide-nucleotide amidase